jgi:hypothetical protein
MKKLTLPLAVAASLAFAAPTSTPARADGGATIAIIAGVIAAGAVVNGAHCGKPYCGPYWWWWGPQPYGYHAAHPWPWRWWWEPAVTVKSKRRG